MKKELYAVTYEWPANPYRTYHSNEVRGIRSKMIEGLDNAKAFAATVNTIDITDCRTGSKVK